MGKQGQTAYTPRPGDRVQFRRMGEQHAGKVLGTRKAGVEFGVGPLRSRLQVQVEYERDGRRLGRWCELDELERADPQIGLFQ